MAVQVAKAECRGSSGRKMIGSGLTVKSLVHMENSRGDFYCLEKSGHEVVTSKSACTWLGF